MTRVPFDYQMVWAATYATAYHAAYLRNLETGDSPNDLDTALDRVNVTDCIKVADAAVDDLRTADEQRREREGARSPRPPRHV